MPRKNTDRSPRTTPYYPSQHRGQQCLILDDWTITRHAGPR